MDIQSILSEIIQAVSYGAGIAMILALCEWVTAFFYRAITDKLGGK